MASGYMLTDYDWFGETSHLVSLSTAPTGTTGATAVAPRPREARVFVVQQEKNTKNAHKIGAIIRPFDAELSALLGMEL